MVRVQSGSNKITGNDLELLQNDVTRMENNGSLKVTIMHKLQQKYSVIAEYLNGDFVITIS